MSRTPTGTEALYYNMAAHPFHVLGKNKATLKREHRTFGNTEPW
jgi:hypothetical protein